MTNRIRKYRWGRWLVFLVALEIIALSINFFYAPIDIAAGGDDWDCHLGGSSLAN